MSIEPQRSFNPPMRAFVSSAFIVTFVVTAFFTLAVPANAEPDSQSFEARNVRVVNFVGTLDVAVGDLPGIEVDITGSPEMIEDVGLRLDGDILIIARKGMMDHNDQPFDAGDYPTVRLRVPVATALTIQGMDGLARIGDIAAPLSVHAASVDLIAGNVTTAMIDRSGSGRIELGNVSGPVVARLGGSGDFVVGTAGEADIEKRGSGDIDVSHVEGAFKAQVRGSGNVTAANVGTASVEKHGSGNVRFGKVASGFTYVSYGIGDVDVEAVDGPVVVETSSSGEVHIHEGRADPLKVVMREYGNFTMDGEAVDPDLTAEGASTVKINSYLGELVARGTGFFDVKRR